MSNLLNKTRTYLIGAMQYENGEDWRNVAKRELSKLGIVSFDPYYKPFVNENPEDEEMRNALKSWMENGRFDLVHERMKSVRADDLRLCDLSDFFIVRINPLVPSWGSAEEITTANRRKAPIFVIIEGGVKKCPLWLLGMLPPKYFYNSLDEALKMIQDIDSGKVKMDSERWRLLKPEHR